MTLRPIKIAAAAVLALAPLTAAVPAASAARASACGAWTVVPSPHAGSLSGVSATGPHDVWAVGSYDASGAYRTLIEHWNGTRWSVLPSPDPASGALTKNVLGAVVALSRTNAWAVGFYQKSTTSFRTLIVHWNGSRWSVVPSPDSGKGENVLFAVAARSAHDIWAVGYAHDPDHRRTLVEHWAGSRWSISPSPSIGPGDNFLFGVAVPATGTPWAVGSDYVAFGSTLAMRWTGSTWFPAVTPNPGAGDRFLQAVTTPAARYALAVGSNLNDAGTQTLALAELWTGSAWTQVLAANPGADYNSLQAVAATSRSDAWAVGTRRTTPGGPFRTLAEHWNGTAFTLASSPSPGHGDDWLYGVAAVPHGGWWAVGNAGNATLAEFRC